MSYILSKEVADYVQLHGEGMAGGEIAVLYALAERAGHDGKYARLAWDCDDWQLQKASGTKDPSGLRKILIKLSARGIDVRVSHGTDKIGRPIYACRNMQVTYTLPKLGAEADDKGVPDGTPISEAADEGVPNGTEGVPNGTPAVPTGTPSVPDGTPFPSFPVFESPPPSSSSSGPRHTNGTDATAAAAADPTIEESPKPRGSLAIAVGVVLTNTDATDDEAAAVVDRINEAKQPRNPVGLVRSIAAAGELDDWLADVRAERAERPRPPEVDGAAERKWLATLSRCDHDQAGGWVPRAKHGTPSCPSCRRAAEDDMATYKRESFGRMLNEDIQRPTALTAHHHDGKGSARARNGANGHHNGRSAPGNVWRGPYRETTYADGQRDMAKYYKPL